ncbi:MAG: class I SAM-dependent methyltransferase [Oscillospiraceae bacterium]|nr:class I SAM-dependent methyltransferase [Oscillospiraceae bacterium]
MDQQEIIRFFDRYAPGWDADLVRKEPVITQILDNAGIRPGMDVLDVACGTGVLFPDYLARNVGSLTAIDISPEMAKIARSKFPEVDVLCGGVETADFSRQFDAIVVYNAFPHFPEPARLIGRLAALLKPCGRLTVAHGMSREAINRHHEGTASKVSRGLPEVTALGALFVPYFAVDVLISDDEMYQVAGTKR